MFRLFQSLRNLNFLAFFSKESFITHIKYLKAKCLEAMTLLKVFLYVLGCRPNYTSQDLAVSRQVKTRQWLHNLILDMADRKSYLQMLDPVLNQ